MSKRLRYGFDMTDLVVGDKVMIREDYDARAGRPMREQVVVKVARKYLYVDDPDETRRWGKPQAFERGTGIERTTGYAARSRIHTEETWALSQRESAATSRIAKTFRSVDWTRDLTIEQMERIVVILDMPGREAE